ncbi:MAG TPA: histidinol-phosphatase [Gemmatimonadaceae bacterium]|nr:histidinol-phosphatase [Gemmatimonadaceae bacterium]
MIRDSQEIMEAVRDVAVHAGQVAHSFFGRRLDVEQKIDGSPVTVADRSAEEAARTWIEKRFPSDGFAGEEFGAVRPDARRRWIVDPIDGTKAFVRGVPLWGTLVALCDGDEVIAGAARFPALDETLVAALGQGCWWNGRRAHVSGVSSISESLVLTTDPEFRATPDRRLGWERLSAAAAHSRSWGDCYGYLLVATGRAEVMVDPIMADWDSAALYPAIVEAGGVFTDWSGNVTALGGSAVATNRAVSAAARALLEESNR